VSGAGNIQASNSAAPGQLTSPSPAVVDYIADPTAVAVAYSNLNPSMYSSSPVPYGASSSTENLYMTQSIHSGGFYPSAENLFHQYRLQGGYYPDYHHHHHHPSSPYVANGFLPYEGYGLASPVVNTKEEKWHDEKYYNNSSGGGGSDLNHSTNGRHNFNYDASSQPVNCTKSRSKRCFMSIIK
jgi:hypothetical protein